mgnify:CR=1 FL=1|jgi:hypothetical protein
MSRSYDYFWTSKILIASGANELLKNNDGHQSINGVDGDVNGVKWIAALTSAHNKKELELALKGLEEDLKNVDKGDLVMSGMSKKRSAKSIWTADIDKQFKILCNKL